MPSSVIRSFAYDAQAKTLDVTFVSGRWYLYRAVPPETAQALQRAESKGRFFNAEIRDVFVFEDLTRRRARPL
jgi:lysyl-tRNA synthetase class 2